MNANKQGDRLEINLCRNGRAWKQTLDIRGWTDEEVDELFARVMEACVAGPAAQPAADPAADPSAGLQGASGGGPAANSV